MDEKDDRPEREELTSRPPTKEDLVSLCRELNQAGARYCVVGGFAIILGGYPRFTGDIDLVIDSSIENEALVRKALETLPDRAIDEMEPGEVARYKVIRIADEFVVDLMESACGVDYQEVAKDLVFREIDGVQIPFASPRMLWRMKKSTHREKDLPDLLFLAEWFRTRGEDPPA